MKTFTITEWRSNELVFQMSIEATDLYHGIELVNQMFDWLPQDWWEFAGTYADAEFEYQESNELEHHVVAIEENLKEKE